VVLPESESVISALMKDLLAGYYNQFINTQLDLIQSPKILEKSYRKAMPPDIKKHYLPTI
jgi:hypothetical protein